MPPRHRARIERLYFPGGVFVPAPGSRLFDVMQTGQPLSIPLQPGQTHAQVLADLMQEAGCPDGRLVFCGEDGKTYAAPLVPSAAPVPGAPGAPAEVPCGSCGKPTPGGVCDDCIETAGRLGVDLAEILRRRRAASSNEEAG